MNGERFITNSTYILYAKVVPVASLYLTPEKRVAVMGYLTLIRFLKSLETFLRLAHSSKNRNSSLY